MSLYDLDYCEAVLETYDLNDIFELNDKTEAEVLEFLLDKEFIE